ncbi:MAG TPA: hypothetical protein VNF68_03065 [Candidatus Baltobacteraceae bacterium]|nr:hypothetical protein [Candidatus Baltobacteraceae bacterium]
MIPIAIDPPATAADVAAPFGRNDDIHTEPVRFEKPVGARIVGLRLRFDQAGADREGYRLRARRARPR